MKFPVSASERSEGPCKTKLDLCLIIDNSGSIRDRNPSDGSHDNWQMQMDFLSNFVSAFFIGPDTVHIGAVVFSEQAYLAFSLATFDSQELIQQALLAIPYIGGSSNTPAALRVTRTQCFNPSNGDRPDVGDMAILITDGVPFPPSRREPAIVEAMRLQDSGVRMISIGITARVDDAFLQEMSSPPHSLNSNYFKAADFTELHNMSVALFSALAAKACGTEEGLCFVSV